MYPAIPVSAVLIWITETASPAWIRSTPGWTVQNSQQFHWIHETVYPLE